MPSLDREGRTAAAVLRARALSRLDRHGDALEVLESAESEATGDVRWLIEALRGSALVGLGRGSSGLELLRGSAVRADAAAAAAVVLDEIALLVALGHWVLGEYDAADCAAAQLTNTSRGLLAARAAALRGWVDIGRMRYCEALEAFRDCLRRYATCVERDAAFEASVIHAIANYELQTLRDHDSPRFYSAWLPDVPGSSLDVYRALIGILDAERAALCGEEGAAFDAIIATDAAAIAAPWRAFTLSVRGRIAHGFGHEHLARSTSLAVYALAVGIDWEASPAESRLALLAAARLLAAYDVTKAQHCLAIFSKIKTSIDTRYFAGAHPLHRAYEADARGVVALAAGESNGLSSVAEAVALFESIGFAWRAAEASLGLKDGHSSSHTATYVAGCAFLRDRFPASMFAGGIPGHRRLIAAAHEFNGITRAQRDIALMLCDGMSVREIATTRGSAVGTVYNQLKDLYRRTGLRSIADVIRRYGRLSA